MLDLKVISDVAAKACLAVVTQGVKTAWLCCPAKGFVCISSTGLKQDRMFRSSKCQEKHTVSTALQAALQRQQKLPP